MVRFSAGVFLCQFFGLYGIWILVSFKDKHQGAGWSVSPQALEQSRAREEIKQGGADHFVSHFFTSILHLTSNIKHVFLQKAV